MAEADWAQLRAFRGLVAQQARLTLPGYHPYSLPHPRCPAGLSAISFYCRLLYYCLTTVYHSLLPTSVYCYACQARRQVYATSRPPFANPNPNTQARRQTADGRPPFVLPLAECSLDREARALDGESMGDWMGRHGLSSTALRWFVEYATRDDYGATLHTTLTLPPTPTPTRTLAPTLTLARRHPQHDLGVGRPALLCLP